MRYILKIIDSIIAFVAIYMIYFKFRNTNKCISNKAVYCWPKNFSILR